MTSGGGGGYTSCPLLMAASYLLPQDRLAACDPFGNVAVLFCTHMLPHGRVYYCGTLLPSGDLPSAAESGDATGLVAPFSLTELLVLPKFSKRLDILVPTVNTNAPNGSNVAEAAKAAKADGTSRTAEALGLWSPPYLLSLSKPIQLPVKMWLDIHAKRELLWLLTTHKLPV